MALDKPRLSEHVLARRHRIDGVERIALHDSRDGSLSLLTPVDWEVLRCADGERSLDAIVEMSIGRCTAQEVVDLFRDLAREALVTFDDVCGPASPSGNYVCPAPLDSADRPVEELPGYALVCDGAGECCAQYASIVLTTADLERAGRAGLACLEEGAFSGEPLMPFAGARSDRVALPIVDGACAELTSTGRCGLHERGGPDAKPVACTAFPRVLVDDGEVVRSSVACECACVFRSLDRPFDASKGAPGATAAGLPAGLHVRVLPALIRLTAGVAARRAAVVAWSRRALGEEEPFDVVRRLLDEAASLRAEAGRAVLAADPTMKDVQIDRDTRLALAVQTFAVRTRAALEAADAWRSARDRTRLLRKRVADAAERATRSDASATSVPPSRDEAFFYRAALHGHAFVEIGVPLADALERAAAWLVVARSLGEDAGFVGHPLAAVLAVSRGMGE